MPAGAPRNIAAAGHEEPRPAPGAPLRLRLPRRVRARVAQVLRRNRDLSRRHRARGATRHRLRRQPRDDRRDRLEVAVALRAPRAAPRPTGSASSGSFWSAFITVATSDGGRSGTMRRRRPYGLADDLRDDRARVAVVRRATREQLVEDDAERPEIGAVIDLRRRADLLRRHVVDGSEDGVGRGEAARAVGDVLRDAEVEDLERACDPSARRAR